MRFHILIDNDLPPVYARCLDPFVRQVYDGSCVALKDMFPPDTEDDAWIGELDRESQQSGICWCYFTADFSMRRNRTVNKALVSARVPGFFLRSSFKNQDLNLQLSKIFGLMPDIQKQTEHCHRQNNPSRYEISAQANKLKSLR